MQCVLKSFLIKAALLMRCDLKMYIEICVLQNI